jgi:hypothetical protein
MLFSDGMKHFGRYFQKQRVFKKILGEFFQNVRRKNIFVHEKNNFLGRNKNPVRRDASSRGSQQKFLTIQ